MPFMTHHSPEEPADAKTRQSDGLLSLAALCAGVLLAALLMVTLLADISRQASVLTAPANALAVAAAAWSFLLLVVYPMWPRPLLGDGDPVDRFGRWLLLRAVEVLVLAMIALPMLLVAAIFAGDPLVRVAHVLAGLGGAAVAAVACRLAHRACAPPWRSAALIDVMLWFFGPVVLGYLLLEHSGNSIGWGWLVSPAALARHVALDGLAVGADTFWVGPVGYGAAGLLALVLFRHLAARFRRESSPHARHDVL